MGNNEKAILIKKFKQSLHQVNLFSHIIDGYWTPQSRHRFERLRDSIRKLNDDICNYIEMEELSTAKGLVAKVSGRFPDIRRVSVYGYYFKITEGGKDILCADELPF